METVQLTLCSMARELKHEVLHQLSDCLFPLMAARTTSTTSTPNKFVAAIAAMERKARLKHAAPLFRAYRSAVRNLRAMAATNRAWKAEVDTFWRSIYNVLFPLRRAVDLNCKLPKTTAHVENTNTRWYEVATLLCIRHAAELPTSQNFTYIVPPLYKRDAADATKWKPISHSTACAMPPDAVFIFTKPDLTVSLQSALETTPLVYFRVGTTIFRLNHWRRNGKTLSASAMKSLLDDRYDGSLAKAKVANDTVVSQMEGFFAEIKRLSSPPRKRKVSADDRIEQEMMAKMPRYE